MGYNCAIKRLKESDDKGLRYNDLYPPFSEDLFSVSLTCHNQAVRNAKLKASKEQHMEIISKSFTDLDSTLFKNTMQLQAYKLLFNYSIYNINKARQIQIDGIRKACNSLVVPTTTLYDDEDFPYKDLFIADWSKDENSSSTSSSTKNSVIDIKD